MQKKIIFFSYNLSVGTLSSALKTKFLAKILCSNFFCKNCFSPLNTFMRKGKDPEPDPDLYLLLMDPKTWGILTTGGYWQVWKIHT
jgi:hypothetical protein